MKPEPNSPDPLDALFKSQPVKPPADFAERTLARLEDELAARPDPSALDDELDALLAAQPLQPRANLADRVLAELDAETAKEPQDNKVVGFPSWVVALGSIAALMVLGMFSFIMLFDHAKQQQGGANGGTMAKVEQPAFDTPAVNELDLNPVETTTVFEIPATETDTIEYYAEVEPAVGDILPENSEVAEYETVLSLDETLEDALMLADLETLNSLQAFLN
ncbi:hypothetical protein [Cerasicoccus frondis]|uniref:hypothetical protein n=1 Tax=Cerasicoccus frondis TaxID=490090 RepID=UPI0028524F3D|nr:hypothetical protein [Cerasicoccus frondis]